MAPPALRLNVMIGHFPYAGNGACSAEHPDIREWEVETTLKAIKDPRVGDFKSHRISDTPLTMTRNRMVRIAKQLGYHLLLLVDSDQSPNLHRGEPWFKPFWDEAFTFIYDRYQKGPHVVFAPYCGPPNGTENVYVFRPESLGNHFQETGWKLDPYTRTEAARMSGIQEAGAGPTGMILIDLRATDLIEPVAMSKDVVLGHLIQGKMTKEEALYALRDGYFYYEYKDQYCDEKASTEDVTFTRDIALAGLAKLGYNPIYCAWNSWVGHHKPWNVGKPKLYTMEHVNASYRKAVLDSVSAYDRITDIGSLIDDPHLTHLASKATLAHSSRLAADPGQLALYGNMTTKDTSEGSWLDHGHAPEKHLETLQDVVRAHSHKVQRPIRVMEIGSWLGSSAIAMADSMDDAEVHCVDHWQGTPTDITGELVSEAGGGDRVYEEFERRIGTRKDTSIFPWRMSSEAAAKKYWKPFDIIFIDADHTYEGCLADIKNWWQHLRDDGVMVGHDYLVHGYDGVVKAVKECFGDKVDTIGWHPQGCMWLVRKSECPKLLNVSTCDSISTRYWGPQPTVVATVEAAASGKALVVDVGPGARPFALATEYVGRRSEGVVYDKTFHEINLEVDRLPYEDQSVDFIYCRHVIEDLNDPEWLLSEIRRVAKAGFIETPSPLAEATHGVDAPGSLIQGRGYSHHRSVVWTSGGVLLSLPKLPVWDSMPLQECHDDLNANAMLWNTYHLWDGPLQYRVFRNECDFWLGVDERYEQLAVESIRVARVESAGFVQSKNPQGCVVDRKSECSELLNEHLQTA